MSRVRIPIRRIPREVSEGVTPVVERDMEWAGLTGRSEVALNEPEPAATTMERDGEHGRREQDAAYWRDRALRLQAEMENYRKRQQRQAEERVSADRERLLRAFLRVGDDLERALDADGVDAGSLRRGVDLTHQGFLRILRLEGVEVIEAQGRPFDPGWHEAVSTVPASGASAEPDTVVQVVAPGYRVGDRVLRPTKVVVAI